MTSPNEDGYDEELTEEEQELVEAFVAQLDGGVSYDINDEQHYLTAAPEGLVVPITPDQADEYSQAVYDLALARVFAARPDVGGRSQKTAYWAIGLSLTSIIVAGAARLVYLLLSW